MMRILGIDFGQKRIGLAVSDPLGFTAQGLKTILVKDPALIVGELRQACQEHNITEIVIGLPLNMNGTVGPNAQSVLEFKEKLQTELKIPVKTWDERLSSRQADRFMIEEGLSRRKQKQNSDRIAATLILQSYLDSKRSLSSN